MREFLLSFGLRDPNGDRGGGPHSFDPLWDINHHGNRRKTGLESQLQVGLRNTAKTDRICIETAQTSEAKAGF